jgi:uncharacterized membrane protein
MQELRLVVLPLVLAMSLTAVPTAAAQPSESYEVIEIAAELGPGIATAVNQQGVVVGNTDFSVPWVWRNGTRSNLPTLGGAAAALAINTRGDVVGWAENGADGPWVGVRWSRNRIEVLEGFSAALGINDRGEIVGNGPAGPLHQRNGKTNVLPHDGQSASALAINQHGLIVGAVDNKAVAWRNGVLEYLPVTQGWPEYETSVAINVSDRGHIVGNLHGTYPYSGFRLDPNFDYDILTPGWFSGYLVGISAVDRFGRAAGYDLEESSTTAFIWLPGAEQPIRLGSYRDPEAWLGWWSSWASGMNNRGIVVGSIQDWWTGEYTAVMWRVPR